MQRFKEQNTTCRKHRPKEKKNLQNRTARTLTAFSSKRFVTSSFLSDPNGLITQPVLSKYRCLPVLLSPRIFQTAQTNTNNPPPPPFSLNTIPQQMQKQSKRFLGRPIQMRRNATIRTLNKFLLTAMTVEISL